MKKSELKKLNKEIFKRKRAIISDLLDECAKSLDDMDKVRALLDKAQGDEDSLNRVRATADMALSQYLHQKLKAGFRQA